MGKSLYPFGKPIYLPFFDDNILSNLLLCPPRNSIKTLRSVLGMVNVVTNFIPDLAPTIYTYFSYSNKERSNKRSWSTLGS